tara:strand:+ start:187 stop:477 length:291 start_codon:yes stop_codon:yes gene_type:complete
MAEEKENNTSVLLSNLKGLVKQYVIYDAQTRLIASYTAPIDVVPGKPCVETRYGFRNGTSNDVLIRKEKNSVWDPDNQNWDDDALLAPLPSPLVNL